MWFILQATIICSVIYVYMTQIHDNPNNTIGYVFTLAVIVAYGVTWVISKTIDAVKYSVLTLRNVYLYARGGRRILGGGEQADSQRRIDRLG